MSYVNLYLDDNLMIDRECKVHSCLKDTLIESSIYEVTVSFTKWKVYVGYILFYWLHST